MILHAPVIIGRLGIPGAINGGRGGEHWISVGFRVSCFLLSYTHHLMSYQEKSFATRRKTLPPGGSEPAFGDNGHEYKRWGLAAPINRVPAAKQGLGPVLALGEKLSSDSPAAGASNGPKLLDFGADLHDGFPQRPKPNGNLGTEAPGPDLAPPSTERVPAFEFAP